jgi:hypothetical protein
MGGYIAHLNNPNLDWITTLTILDDGAISRSGWLQLSKLTNLGALWVDSRVRDGGSLDDSVLKVWSTSAQLSNGFAALRFFHLLSRAAFNGGVLGCLHNLPLLQVVHLQTLTRPENIDPAVERKARWHIFTPPTLFMELSMVYLQPAQKPAHAALVALKNLPLIEGRKDNGLIDDVPILSVMMSPDPARVWDISGLLFNTQSHWFIRAAVASDTTHAKRELIQSPNKHLQPKRPRLRDATLMDTNDLLRQLSH